MKSPIRATGAGGWSGCISSSGGLICSSCFSQYCVASFAGCGIGWEMERETLHFFGRRLRIRMSVHQGIDDGPGSTTTQANNGGPCIIFFDEHRIRLANRRNKKMAEWQKESITLLGPVHRQNLMSSAPELDGAGKRSSAEFLSASISTFESSSREQQAKSGLKTFLKRARSLKMAGRKKWKSRKRRAVWLTCPSGQPAKRCCRLRATFVLLERLPRSANLALSISTWCCTG